MEFNDYRANINSVPISLLFYKHTPAHPYNLPLSVTSQKQKDDRPRTSVLSFALLFVSISFIANHVLVFYLGLPNPSKEWFGRLDLMISIDFQIECSFRRHNDSQH